LNKKYCGIITLSTSSLQNKNKLDGNHESMKKLQIVLILTLLSFQIAFCQIKKLEGDTSYWFKSTKEFQKTLNLKDFEKSSDEFNFRFRNHGQVVEITKDSSGINGNITNYIYHTIKSNRNKTENFI
jgi:hypothetical protein